LIACTWLLSVGFNLLINLGRFRLFDATCLWLLVAAGCAVFLPKPRRRTSVLAYALRVTRRHALVYLGLGALLLLQLLRCLTEVPLAWDSMTYHAVKSALWVQTGAHIALDMPGYWSCYRYYLSGGEALSAWAMLPFHSDLLYSVADFVFWVGLGVALYEIARELGARGWGRLLAAVYLMFLPAIFREVGTGYVETSLDFALFGTALLLVRYLKTWRGGYLVVAGMALGVALAIKTTAIAYAGVWMLVVLGRIFIKRRPSGTELRALGGAAVCACLAFVPWAVHFTLETGYPLGTTPMTVAGVPLGKTTDEARLLMESKWPPRNAYHLDAELQALRDVFAPPWQGLYACSAASLLPMLLGAIALALPKSRTVAGWALLPMAPMTLFILYQPSFSYIRMNFANLNGRFVFPLVAVLVLYAVANARLKPLAIALNVYLLVATGVHIYAHYLFGWSDVDQAIVAMGALLTGAPLLLIARWRPGALRPALAVLTAVTLIAAAYWKEADRDHFLNRNQVIINRMTYWLPAVEALREHREPLRIAITVGTKPYSGDQFMYHFFGARLQNTLCYVPLTEDGHIVPHAPEYDDTPLSYGAWLQRLIENKVTHVVTFRPESVELGWMRQAPDQFREVVNGDSWGLFECTAAASQVPGASSHENAHLGVRVQPGPRVAGGARRSDSTDRSRVWRAAGQQRVVRRVGEAHPRRRPRLHRRAEEPGSRPFLRAGDRLGDRARNPHRHEGLLCLKMWVLSSTLDGGFYEMPPEIKGNLRDWYGRGKSYGIVTVHRRKVKVREYSGGPGARGDSTGWHRTATGRTARR
jgi:hypothetical protein